MDGSGEQWKNMEIATLAPPPRQTANPAPVRPLNSIRRTSSIDVFWPDGRQGDRVFIGNVRDLLTPATGADATVCAAASMEARLAEDKTIKSITAQPEHPNLGKLVGERAGGHLRLFLREEMPDLLAGGEPLYLALDDLSGSALVSGFALSQWTHDADAEMRARMVRPEFDKMMKKRADVCWGLKQGSSGLDPLATNQAIADADAKELRNPDDPEGWHEFPVNEGPGFRRARRIDVIRDEAAGLLRIDSAFQDSAKVIEGGRVAIHEYGLSVTADPQTLEILSIVADPRILPFPECPGAVHNTQRLVGARIADMRDEVLAKLRGTQGCTHLNDALRALAEVPKLVSYL